MSLENQLPMQAMVSSQAELKPGQQTMRLALFDSSGDPVDFSGGAAPTGADVDLTGYEIGAGVVAVAASDSVNDAIAKLEARLVALEGA